MKAVSESSLNTWYTGVTLTQIWWTGRWASLGGRDFTGCQQSLDGNILLFSTCFLLHLSLGFTELCSHARIHRCLKWNAIDSSYSGAICIPYYYRIAGKFGRELRWRVSKNHCAHDNYWFLHRSYVNFDLWTQEVSRRSAAAPHTPLATSIGSSLEKSIEKWKD